MEERKRTSKKQSSGFSWTPWIIVLALVGLVLTIYISIRVSVSDQKLFSVGLIALFIGLLFESYRVSDSWKSVLAIFIGSYFLSLFNFLPYKHERNYLFENHIESWPFVFIFFYTMGFAIFFKDRVTTKLTEGITLIQSLSLIYWTIDFGFINYDNGFVIFLITIAYLLTGFSIVNALTNLNLSRTIRLILSIWSTIVMFAFALDNIYRVFSNPDIGSSEYLYDNLYIGLQYFFLGVSAVYIMQNYILLAGFLPSRNGNYRRELMEIKKDHIERYSEEQVFVGHSLLCIVYSVILYGLNYAYEILPRHTMIWLVFLTFPLFLRSVDIALFGRRN